MSIQLSRTTPYVFRLIRNRNRFTREDVNRGEMNKERAIEENITRETRREHIKGKVRGDSFYDKEREQKVEKAMLGNKIEEEAKSDDMEKRIMTEEKVKGKLINEKERWEQIVKAGSGVNIYKKVQVHSCFSGSVKCWASSMGNSFQVTIFKIEDQNTSNLVCLAKNGSILI